MVINYYEILGINQNATETEIEKSLKENRRMWSNRSSNAPKPEQRYEAQKLFNLVPKMKETLLNASKRAEYDKTLANEHQKETKQKETTSKETSKEEQKEDSKTKQEKDSNTEQKKKSEKETSQKEKDHKETTNKETTGNEQKKEDSETKQEKGSEKETIPKFGKKISLVVLFVIIFILGLSIFKYFSYPTPQIESTSTPTPTIPTPTPTPTPTIPTPTPTPIIPTPIPTPTPKSYTNFSNNSVSKPSIPKQSLSHKWIAPFEIKNKNENNYLIKLVNVYNNTSILTVFVQSGRTVNIKVPIGIYEFQYTCGKFWYGEKYLFGSDYVYSKLDKTLEFKVIGNQIIGYSVILYKDSIEISQLGSTDSSKQNYTYLEDKPQNNIRPKINVRRYQ